MAEEEDEIACTMIVYGLYVCTATIPNHPDHVTNERNQAPSSTAGRTAAAPSASTSTSPCTTSSWPPSSRSVNNLWVKALYQ